MRKTSWKKAAAALTAAALVLTQMAVPQGTTAAAKMKLNKKKVTLKVGKKVKLKLKNAKKKVSWKSSSKKIASVTKKGIVMGKKPGKAKITAKCQGKKFICKVTVMSGESTVDILSSTMPAATINVPVSTGSPTPKGTKIPAAASAFPSKTPVTSAGVKTTTTPGTQQTNSPADKASETPETSGTPEMPSTAEPSETPETSSSARPDGTAEADSSALPSGTPETSSSALPSEAPETSPSALPSGAPKTSPSAPMDSSTYMPQNVAEGTLAVGKFNIRLGMSKTDVENILGNTPDIKGMSPQQMETYMYNPSGDYKNLIELQFKDGKVAEMSTISAYFCYADLVSSEDTVQTLDKNFSSMKVKYDYEAGYQCSDDTAYVTAFADHQGDGKIYGVQIFDKNLASGLDQLILPKNCSYTGTDLVSTMKAQMEAYVNAFRVSKQLDPMTIEKSDAAQTQADYMASSKKNTTRDADGVDYSDRFADVYGDPYVKTEFTGDSCVDAFSYVIYAVDTTKNAASGKQSNIYRYMVMEEGSDGDSVDMHVSCGFAVNTNSKQYTFGVIDVFGF